jgi:hypothetical protein
MSFIDLLTWKFPQQQLTLAGYSKAADATFFVSITNLMNIERNSNGFE